MCGRFFILDAAGNALLAGILTAASRRLRALTGEERVAQGEVFPSAAVAALAMGKHGQISAFPMLWGFHRANGKGLIINTRSESALNHPIFRPSMLVRRCLIPCSWYFEWEERTAQQSFSLPSLQIQGKEAPPRRKDILKIKYAIRPKAPGLMYLAAIYRYEEGQKLPVLSILTRDASPDIAFIHDRMPVIFTEETRGAWLDRDADPQKALSLCEEEMNYRSC